MTYSPSQINYAQTNDVESWFDTMVANLRYDQVLFENDILEDEKKKMYDAMISNNHEYINNLGRQSSSAYFISEMVNSYFKELVRAKHKPSKLALELSNSKILVWAEIYENDEQMENALILAEAKTNAHFSKFGFHISSTIVENTDSLEIPKHYKSVTIN